MAKDWDDTNTSAGGSDERVKLDALCLLADKKEYRKKWKDYRPLPGLTSYKQTWIPIFKNGKPVMKDGKQVKIPKISLTYNPETEEHDRLILGKDGKPVFLDSKGKVVKYAKLVKGKPCDKAGAPLKGVTPASDPYERVVEALRAHYDATIKDDTKRREISPYYKKQFVTQMIDRQAEEDMNKNLLKKMTPEEKKTGIKDMDSKTPTPVRVFAFMPASQASKIKEVKTANSVKDKSGEKKYYMPTHEKYGCDVQLKFDPDQTGTGMYDARKGEAGRTPLTEEQLAYLKFDLDAIIDKTGLETYEDAKAEADRMLKNLPASAKGGGDSDDEDDLPDDIEDDDDASSKKKKKGDKDKGKSKAKKPADDEDEDDVDIEDDDIDDDEDEEDEKPAKKKGKDKSKKSSKKSKDEDEDDDEDDDGDLDEDEEDEEDEDEEDEKPAKKKGKDKSAKGKSKSKDEDEDEDEDGDEDDDLDDIDDDLDEDEDEEDDDDEDEEDEKPAKKKNTKKGGKTSSKKSGLRRR